jgi:hypothetical protein
MRALLVHSEQTSYLQERCLSASVLADQSISAPDGQLNAAVLDQLIAHNAQGETVDLDVTRSGAGRQHTCTAAAAAAEAAATRPRR